MLRLAFLARLVKTNQCTFNALTATVNPYKHRDHIRTPEYLAQLPGLFPESFDLPKQTTKEVIAPLADLLEKKEWTHRDGMEAAWRLVAQDIVMSHQSHKFTYFTHEGATPKELFKEFFAKGLKHTLSPDNPVAIITVGQSVPSLTAMIRQAFPKDLDAIDILVPADLQGEFEQKLFNNTRDQGIMIRLFAMRNALKNSLNVE